MKLINNFIKESKKDHDKYVHFFVGYFVNLFVIVICTAIFSPMIGPMIGIIACAVIWAGWEVYQRFTGGTNSMKEIFMDFFAGFTTAILWFILIPKLF